MKMHIDCVYFIISKKFFTLVNKSTRFLVGLFKNVGPIPIPIPIPIPVSATMSMQTEISIDHMHCGWYGVHCRVVF